MAPGTQHLQECLSIDAPTHDNASSPSCSEAGNVMQRGAHDVPLFPPRPAFGSGCSRESQQKEIVTTGNSLSRPPRPLSSHIQRSSSEEMKASSGNSSSGKGHNGSTGYALCYYTCSIVLVDVFSVMPTMRIDVPDAPSNL